MALEYNAAGRLYILLLPLFCHQVFDDSKTAGRFANRGVQKFEHFRAGVGDKFNQGADKAVKKVRELEVLHSTNTVPEK